MSANARKMMAVMENITKLVRANKFTLDTVLYKVGEDAISDAFSRAADASDSAQVVLIFPTLKEELENEGDVREASRPMGASSKDKQDAKKKEEDERDKLKTEWLNLLFTSQSVAASSPEGPLPISMETGNKRGPACLIVWMGDSPKKENALLKEVGNMIGSSAMMAVSWSQHAAGEGLQEFNLSAPEVTDGSWYARDRKSFENEDLDMLHDFELLGRSMVETVESKIGEYGLEWKDVVLAGFGKGAGIALYASLLKIIPSQVKAMIAFSPVVPFPSFLAEKIVSAKRGQMPPMKMFTIWGNRNRATPAAYKKGLENALKKAPEIQCTPDNLPEGDTTFDDKAFDVLTSLLPLCLPR